MKELARQLRNNSTLGEVLLWKELKGSAFLGFDFRHLTHLYRTKQGNTYYFCYD